MALVKWFARVSLTISSQLALSDVKIGAVTSLALSHDHTWVASGHASGHVRVFDLKKPGAPSRVVSPTSPAAVKEGRREGHFPRVAITSIGFVAGRHTAIVTADENGLAFYHSLGKVLFVDATDVIRILGKYPEDASPEPTLRGGTGPGPIPSRNRRERKVNVILAMAPLPLGTCPHQTDGYNLVAMVTPVKLVIVGLKPKPTTWYRRLRRDNQEKAPTERWKGTLAWFPSVESPPPTPENLPPKSRSKPESRGATPMLIFSWGKQFNFIRVSEKKVMQSVKSTKTGKISEVEFGAIVIEEVSTWITDEVVLAVRWLNANVGPFSFNPETTWGLLMRCPLQQILVLTPNSLQVHDVNTKKLVERSQFSSQSLTSPTLSQTVSGDVTYADSVLDVAHSIWVYKTKIFVLVCTLRI
jgi:vacuolar protein sorting-associated protein 8